MEMIKDLSTPETGLAIVERDVDPPRSDTLIATVRTSRSVWRAARTASCQLGVNRSPSTVPTTAPRMAINGMAANLSPKMQPRLIGIDSNKVQLVLLFFTGYRTRAGFNRMRSLIHEVP